MAVTEFENVLKSMLLEERRNVIHINFTKGDTVPIQLLARRTGLRHIFRGAVFNFTYATCPYCAMEPAIRWLGNEEPFRGIEEAYLAAIKSGEAPYLVINAGRRSWGGLWYRFSGGAYTSLAPPPRLICPRHVPDSS
ncbi:hypothetical protein [Actinomadura decatromicini]|uniref:Uncharacterized protein n=1 Tax=Actinomadura decatromicini TaxID=2604572 RepID=A0A5D3F7F4_9ACTN|nr:hypothetical protein [Actinomadura decatromicini]TYK44113.1 hypothetical protein FXF68_36005 [Actinomadura decatromicini]